MAPAASSSTSKTAIIAGILAGLLAAGLGTYYLHLHHRHAAPAAAAETAPATMPGGGAPAHMRADGPPRSKAQASLALLALPELQAWSARIEQSSGGRAHGALIEDDPAPRVVNGKSYYQFSFVTNSADAASRWESFLVAERGDEILVEDVTTDELLSLARWRQQKQPMARQPVPGGGGG